MNKKSILNSITIIVMGLLLSTGISYAVTPATGNPGGFPNNNTYAPVNVGPQIPATPYQHKAGFLSIGSTSTPASLVVSGLSSFSGNVDIIGVTPPPPPPPPPPAGFNYPTPHKNSHKSFLSAFLDMFVPEKALATITHNCSPDFTTSPVSCVADDGSSWCNDNGYYYNPQSGQCTNVYPPIAPAIYLNAITDYGSGSDVTILPTSFAEIEWSVNGSSPTTCTASASPSTANWTTATTYTAQGLYGYVDLTTARNATRTYTMTCTNSVGTASNSVKINVLTPPANGANLYVSGKACLGNTTVNGFAPTCNSTNPASPVVPTANLEVNGSIKIQYLQLGSPKHLCSNSAGILGIC